MKIILISIVLFVFAQKSFCQNKAQDSIVVIADWKKGDVKRYLYTKSRKDIKKGEVVKDDKQSFHIVLEVLDSDSAGYTLSYKIDSVLLSNKVIGAAQQDAVGALLQDLVYKYKTDAYGKFVELVNKQEILDYCMDLIDLNLSMDNRTPDSEKDKYKESMRNMLSQEGILTLFLKKNIGRLHSYYGYIYPANKVIKFNEMLPMPFGEVSIPAKGTLKVVEEGDEIKFLGSLNIDRKKGKEALIEMVKSMIEKMGSSIEPAKREKMEAEMEKMLFNIDDEEYTLYDKFSGWVKETEYIRTIVARDLNGKTTRVDTIYYNLLD